MGPPMRLPTSKSKFLDTNLRSISYQPKAMKLSTLEATPIQRNYNHPINICKSLINKEAYRN